ncbi:MAG TPA: PDZ domain-containing protein [Planctomycetota bacterium]|nr:PDZ domain-containing protein [Planctomycetota bacterium]
MLLALAHAAHVLAPSPANSVQESPPGWLGVSLTVEEGRDRPLRVTQVEPGAPAERAGLRAGDRLVGLAGRELESYEDLLERLRELGPGREVGVSVHRTLEVELDGRGWGAPDGPRLGVHLGQTEDGDGVHWVVRKAEAGWPAARAGVAAGDRIVDVAGREPRDFDALQAILAEVAPEHELHLTIERDLRVRLGARPGEEPSARYELAPEGPQLQRASPRASMPLVAPDGATPHLERKLREEIAGLNQELRALREELRSLRRALSELRER